MEPKWRIELLRELRAIRGDRVLTRFRTRKTASLLAYLAYHAHRRHSRLELIELLWPESADLQAGRDSLITEISWLRRALPCPELPGSAVLIADRSFIQINPEAVTTDVADFLALCDAARLPENRERSADFLTSAVELYPGHLLGANAHDWLLQERSWLSERYFRALEDLLTLLSQRGEYKRAIDYAHRGISLDPLREEVQCALIRLLAAAGRPAAALRQYHELERLIAQELGGALAAETRDLERQIRDRLSLKEHAPANGNAAPLPDASAEPADRRTGHLPSPLTRFFGREEQITRLSQIWTEAPRLVTLTGPAGSGKTRLAIEVGRRLASHFPGGVWFVPLADLATASLIVGAIRDGMGLPRSPQVEPLEQVVGVFASRPLALLLLDNFEHLVDEGAPLVRTLLDRLPELCCLVTSRHCLNLAGEREFPVPPLPIPDDTWQPMNRGSQQVHALHQCPSVQLFVDRARSVQPDFELTESNAAAVAALCRKLEGIPLAVELAAARSRLLSPAQMMARMERRFDFLVGHRRDAVSRHRTLRAAIDWSYHLLSPALRRFFVRLSVFHGGWTLDAAQVICDEPQALEYLEQLHEGSFIVREEPPVSAEPSTLQPDGAEARYRLLEMLREYGTDQLAPEERAALQHGHAEYYLALAERLEPRFVGRVQKVWADRLEQEHDNMRAALAWWIEGDPAVDTDAGLRLAGALRWFWLLRSHWHEGYRWLMAALARAEKGGTPHSVPRSVAGAKALFGAGHLATELYHFEVAIPLLEESATRWRELGDPYWLGSSLLVLSGAGFQRDGAERARELKQECIVLARETNDDALLIAGLDYLAGALRGFDDWEGVHACCEESAAVARRLGDLWGLAAATEGLANIAMRQGDMEKARSLFAESLTRRREIDLKGGVPRTLRSLARIALSEGDEVTAHHQIREGLEIEWQMGDLLGLAQSLEALAEVDGSQGDWLRTTHRLGAASAVRERLATPPSSWERDELNRNTDRARSVLGDEAFSAAWEVGQSMPLDAAVAEALHDETAGD